jgi:hypothetical protein
MALESAKQKAILQIKEWYNGFSNGGEAERNVVCAGLAIVEKMYTTYPLDREDYVTSKNQLRVTPSLINTKIIKERYGIDKVYSKEAGRTTRSTVTAGESLANRLNALSLDISLLTEEERSELCRYLQDWLILKVQMYFDAQRLEVDFNAEATLKSNIELILRTSSERGITGHVAQHLVGAKLRLRFPDIELQMHSATTADDQLGRSGDFLINNYVFHVTVAPTQAVISKCAENIRNGYRPILVVPENRVQAATQLAENDSLSMKIIVYSIENFISQNIEEIGFFSKTGIDESFGRLLKTYNEIIDEVEGIPSYKIEIPHYLV